MPDIQQNRQIVGRLFDAFRGEVDAPIAHLEQEQSVETAERDRLGLKHSFCE
jgi:hypothetical protein